MDEVTTVLSLQSGTISRQQALKAGLAPHDIRRLLRRREWVVVHPGVMVDHTGPLTWLQRAWAATLAVEHAALSHESAIRALDGPGRHDHGDPTAPIHVAVDRHRKVITPAGVVVHRVSNLDGRVVWNASPPRVRIEEAVIDAAVRARDDLAAIAALADAVQARRTTAVRILACLDGRERIPRRRLLRGALRDIELGTCSVLEHGYLDRVERPHHLPVASRQLSASSRGPIQRDVEYRDQAVVVELDGRLFHDTAAARDRDLDRDLDAAVTGRLTVRLGWGQVYGRPCLTAERIGRLLRARGWTGALAACPQCAPRSIAATG